MNTDIKLPPAEGADQTLAARRVRRHRQWRGAYLGLLAGVAGLAAGRLGQLYPVFDVFAQFGAQFSILALSFAVACLLPRYKGIAGMALTVLLIAAYGAWPHYVSAQPEQVQQLEPGEKALRVAHLNLWYENRDNEAVARELLRLDADIFTLIEFQPRHQPILDAVAARYPYRMDCHDVPVCDLAIISKYPLSQRQAKALWKGPPFMSVEVGGDLKGLKVYAVHTTRFPHFRAQLKQVQAIVRLLEGESGPLLVMGDFNTTPFSRLPGLLEQGAGLKRLTNLPSWPATYGFPQLAIDHIFVSPDLRPISRQHIGQYAGSDHFPITMRLAFKPR